MTRRIYWLIPDLINARRAMNDLLSTHIEAKHIHFAGRDGMDMTGLHAANVLQTSDVVHAAQTGLVIGGAAGVFVGLVAAMFYPIVGDSPQWEVVAVLPVLWGVIGAWSSSMIGISIPSPRLQRFEGAIEQGWILLMVDVLPSRVEEIESLLQASHPEAHFEGVDRHGFAFPLVGVR